MVVSHASHCTHCTAPLVIVSLLAPPVMEVAEAVAVAPLGADEAT